jgi:hypothetical protein
MQGRALLCQSDAEKRDYVVAVRNRLDTRTEFVRAIRDKRYRYQRNFFPHLPFAPYETFQFEASVYERWGELARQGKLDGPQEEYAQRFKPLEQLYDSEKDPHMVNNLAEDPAYADVLKEMRQRLHDWMIETRDLGLVEERELYERANGRSLWAVGQELVDYERILETANLQLERESAVPELKTRSADDDPLVRYWATLGLVVATQTAGPELVEGILPSLTEGLTDPSIDVRLIAAEGLFNLGYYEDALPVVIAEMAHPNTDIQVQVGNLLDSQPPDANAALAAAIEPLAIAMQKFKPQARYGGTNKPFDRAYRALTNQQLYYRWGMGASGSPESPLMAVQKKPFVLKEAPPVKKIRKAPAPAQGKPSALKAIGGKVLEVSSSQKAHGPEKMLDSDLTTFWHTRFAGDHSKLPHYVVLQVPGTQAIKGLRYHAWHGPGNGHLKSCSVYVSDDGKTWGDPLVENATLVPGVKTDQQILFPKPTNKKFIKLEVTDAVSRSGKPIASIGELDVLVEAKP